MKRGPAASADSTATLPPKPRKGLLHWTLVSVSGLAALLIVTVLIAIVMLRYWMTDKDLAWEDALTNPGKVFALATPVPGQDGQPQSPLLLQEGELAPNADEAAIDRLNQLFPDWVPIYPGTTPQNTGTKLTGPHHTLYFEFRTEDRPEQILEFYKAGLTEHGLQILEDRVDIHQAFLRAAADDGRSVILEAPHEGAASLTIDDPSFEGEARP